MPPSSLYCCQRSVSRISAADKNLRMAASPRVSSPPPLSANAVAARPSGPSVAPAPTARPVAKNDRRLSEPNGSRVADPVAPSASASRGRWLEPCMLYRPLGGVVVKSCSPTNSARRDSFPSGGEGVPSCPAAPRATGASAGPRGLEPGGNPGVTASRCEPGPARRTSRGSNGRAPSLLDAPKAPHGERQRPREHEQSDDEIAGGVEVD